MEALLVTFLGLAFGSFVTAASGRMAEDKPWVQSRSACPLCNALLGVRQLVPVFSWVFQRGRCHACKARISWRYPVIELVQALLFLGIYLLFGLTPVSATLMLMSAALWLMTVADLEYGIIPDEVQWACLALGAVMHGLGVGVGWYPGLAGAAAGLGLGLGLRGGYMALKGHHGLGLGDVKFLGVMGWWLGPELLWPVPALAGILGVLLGTVWRLRGGGAVFPFGPALALALLLGMGAYLKRGEFGWLTMIFTSP